MGGGGSKEPNTGYNPDDDPVDMSEIEGHKYDYENLVLEGGGAKACAYAGAIATLEKAGIMKNIKRVAGTSGGAIAGTLVAIGCTSDEVAEYFMPCWEDFADARWGKMSYLPNLFSIFGFNPGNRALTVIQETIGKKLGEENIGITFKQLYERRNVELCIVATNLSSMAIQYFHPKTTPDSSIAEAVRMSLSIPVFLAPYEYENHSRKSYYCDGGVLCNYPIHAFDGWFLSMDPKDSFFRKLHNGRLGWFDRYNPKTIGVCVYELGESDRMANFVFQAPDKTTFQRPDTKLARERSEECDQMMMDLGRKTELLRAIDIVFRFVRELPTSDGKIDVANLKGRYKSQSQEVKDAHKLVYGDHYDPDEFFKYLKENGTKKLKFDDFMDYISKNLDINFEDLTESTNYVKIDGVKSFASAILNTWMSSGANRYNKDYDKARTIGVCTDYIRTMDLDMDDFDLAFIRRQAKVAALEFLKDVKKNGVVTDVDAYLSDIRFEELQEKNHRQ